MLTRKTPLRPGKPPQRKTALKSTGGLKRTGRLPQKRKGGPRRSSRVIDKAYLAFVRTMRCCVCDRPPPSDPHHATDGRGLSQKSDDDRAIPLCRVHHDDAQNRRERFKGWSNATMREWHQGQVDVVRALRTELESTLEKEGLIMAGTKNHYVVFRSPGTLFAEESRRPIGAWDTVKATQMAREIVERHGARPYAFHFVTMLEAPPVEVDGEKLKVVPKRIDKSPVHHLGGDVLRFEDVADIKENSILRSNMRGNGYPFVIQTRHSYLSTQPFEGSDLVVDPETGAIVKRGSDPEFAEYRARMLKEWERA